MRGLHPARGLHIACGALHGLGQTLLVQAATTVARTPSYALLSLWWGQEPVRELTSLLWNPAAAKLKAAPWPCLLHRPSC